MKRLRSFGERVETIHRRVDAGHDPRPDGLGGAIERGVDDLLLGLRKPVEDVIAELALAGVPFAADADPQARELPGTEARFDRLQTLLPRRGPPRLHPQDPEGQVDLVGDDEKRVRLPFQLCQKTRDRLSRGVHVRDRLGEHPGLVARPPPARPPAPRASGSRFSFAKRPATASPEAFMYVIGLASITGSSPILPRPTSARHSTR